jgi:hypothetical protein
MQAVIHRPNRRSFFCPHAGAGFGNDSTHYPNLCRRHHDRAVTCFWLASLHDGKRGTGQISQGDASLCAPTLLERQCGCARAFATTCTLGSARAGATTQNRYQRRRRVTLRFPYEVRQPEEYFDIIDDEKVPKDMLDLAIHIVDSKRGKFEPEKFEDHYENALKELLRKKQKGEKIERPKEPARTNVVNLMEALRQSVQAEGGKQSRATRAQAKKGKKRIEGQREMLLPIAGKKDKEVAVKSTARSTGRHRKTG